MCGIVGILGKTAVANQVVEALKRLEYRGYDSAGVATLKEGRLEPAPRRGQASQPRSEALGGAALRRHRHRPHPLGDPRQAERDQRPSARHRPARRRPQRHHREFPRAEARARRRRASASRPRPTRKSSRSSSRDEMRQGRSAVEAVAAALPRLRGAFALGFLFAGRGGSPDRRAPRRAARHRLSAMARCISARTPSRWRRSRTRSPISRTATGRSCTRGGAEIRDGAGRAGRASAPAKIHTGSFMADKGNHRHFMAKEIHEQPEVVGRTLGPLRELRRRQGRACRSNCRSTSRT